MSTAMNTSDKADAVKTEELAASGPINLDRVRIDPVWALKIAPSLAMRRRVLPLCRLGDSIAVATVGLIDGSTEQSLEKTFGTKILAVEADPESLRRGLMRVYGGVSMPAPVARNRGEDGREGEDAAAICDEILQAAVLREASDIHLLPMETCLSVQLRVDGKLEVYRELPTESQGAVISRLKVLSGLDIAEKRAPQDGRFSSRIGPARRKVDMRVATLPTRFGERMTLRLLANQTSTISLGTLGMNQRSFDTFSNAMNRPHGLILLTGPTGSGKSTTLYAAISELLKRRHCNVITVEDPIEYDMKGVSQVEVDSTDRVSFGKALRSLLRHDPDVVMIGEIRDAETAGIAVKASLTGHLVFSSLHTNTAAGVVTRLADMGVERFLIGATLRLAVAQRLVRRLCPHCHKPRPMIASEALALRRPELEGITIYDASGCVYCAGRGYSGRVAMFEMVEIDQDIARAIGEGIGEAEILADSKVKKLPLLIDDAIEKMTMGITTFAEVITAVVDW